MAVVNWQEILGWTVDQLEEIRFAGYSFLKEGRYEKALVFFKALVAIDPKSVYDIQILGALYLQIGDGKMALQLFDQALALDPTHEPTLLNKVKTQLTLGQKKEAMESLSGLQKSKNLAVAKDAEALYITYS